jgi:colanic acid/amylovoran biosynthesis glycosyltransferase
MKLGILIPEFPGQTHIFFQRELEALRELGAEPEIVSTRRPPAAIMSHSWAQEAMSKTAYLSPPTAAALAGAGGEILRGGPRALARVAGSVARARDVDGKRRVRLLGLAVMGGRLAQLARTRGWQHVHVHSCGDAANVALFANLLAGVPYSMTLHGPLRDYGPNQAEKWRHAKFAIVITQQLLGEVSQDLAGSLPPIVDVAPMGVDVRRFSRAVPYVPWDGHGPLRIFSCGRLNVCKGHGDLVTAVQLLRARGIDARLEIAGEDEQGGSGFHRTLDREIADAGLVDAAKLLGAVSEERVRAGLEGAHVFALASLAEPLGVAIMEAMAIGAPVVATGAGGVPELVRDEQDGLLVPPASPARLADAIERLARDPTLADRMARSGSKRILASFDSSRSAKALLKHATAS